LSVSVLIVDDHGIVREGLRALLESKPGIDVVGDTDNGLEAVRMARKLEPDVVLMDTSMPVMNGIEATRAIVTQNPDTKIIGLSAGNDKKQIFDFLKAGAKGYVNKLSFAAELMQAVDIVGSGRVYISPEIGQIILDSFTEEQTSNNTGIRDILSTREITVLQLLAEGYSSKETADKLNISVKTVGNHKEQLKKKLGLTSVAELTKCAIKENLTEL